MNDKTGPQEELPNCHIEMSGTLSPGDLQEVLLKTVQIAHSHACEELQEVCDELEATQAALEKLKEEYVYDVEQFRKQNNQYLDRCRDLEASNSNDRAYFRRLEAVIRNMEQGLQCPTTKKKDLLKSLQSEGSDAIAAHAASYEKN